MIVRRFRVVALGVLAVICATSHGRAADPFPGTLPGTEIGGQLPGDHEPSGALWHTRLGRLFIVSDNGWVTSMNADGTDVSHSRVFGDLEGVTVADPDSDFIYIGVENPDSIREFDLVTGTVTRTFDLSATMVGPNTRGLEALTFVRDSLHPEGGQFYAGLQEDGRIYVFDLPIVSSSTSTTVSHVATLTPAEGVNDLAGLQYHELTDTVYAIFDVSNLMVALRPDGTVLGEWFLPGNAQEGITFGDCKMFVSEDVGVRVWSYGFPTDPDDADGDGVENCADDCPATGVGLAVDERGCPSGGCQDDLDCDDGQYCNGTERCEEGECLNGDPVDCADAGSCTRGVCNEDEDNCEQQPDDELCDDGVACTTDSCNATTGGCEHRPDDDRCADGDWCNGAETCDPLAGCQSGAAVDCAELYCDDARQECVECRADVDCVDAIECNADFCIDGRCVHEPVDSDRDGVEDCSDDCPGTPGGTGVGGDGCPLSDCQDDAACSDGLFCNGIERCEGGTCVSGAPPDCGGGFCDEAVDSCAQCLEDVHCADANACTLDRCELGVCVRVDDPSDADKDGVVDCVDQCPGTQAGLAVDAEGCPVGRCQSNEECDDGLFCNGLEECEGGRCVTDGAIACDPERFCDEELDTCAECLVDAHCDDGDACTLDGCDAGVCGNVVTDEDGDGFPDCEDPCPADPAAEAGGCPPRECQTDADCADGLFCNGAESCFSGTCIPGDPVQCEQGVCDEELDVCAVCYQDSDCDDDTECTLDSCELGVCVHAGVDADGDAVVDCVDNCLSVANPDQGDFDEDGTGDVCESGALLVDSDQSGRVDGFDLARWARGFALRCDEQGYDSSVDFDRNCVLDGEDLAILASYFAHTVSW